MTKTFSKSRALFERASAVIPGGIYGHASPAVTVPGAFPYFAQSAEGCRYTDVDGNQYIDFMCGYGPIFLGYKHPEVDAAAAEAQATGDCFNHPTEYSVRLAEKLVETIDGADWAVFGKNGSDMTSWAIRVAREHTGRKRVAKVTHAYHGIDPWCVPGYGGVILEDRSQIDNFYWNDLESLEKLIARSASSLAAIIITPFHHPAFDDSVLPTEAFVKAINQACEAHGIILILDDVRGGFRLHPHGSHCRYGWQPDLMCYSKALANGYPISSCAGAKALKIAASKTFLTGSFWNAAAPMAAALKTLEIAERDKVADQIEIQGKRLIDGMLKIGEQHGTPLQVSGPPAMPYVRVANDPSFRKQQALCSEAIQNGLYLHPHHNWFLSAAHTADVIDESLGRFSQCLGTFCQNHSKTAATT
jgi:glutamate-1-semialdehyde 2,1-aminomutase